MAPRQTMLRGLGRQIFHLSQSIPIWCQLTMPKFASDGPDNTPTVRAAYLIHPPPFVLIVVVSEGVVNVDAGTIVWAATVSRETYNCLGINVQIYSSDLFARPLVLISCTTQHVPMYLGLQHAFFMGRGFVPWENVWGVFNGVNEGDGEALRRLRPLLTFVAGLNLTVGGNWTPFTQDAVPIATTGATPDVIAVSRFEAFSQNSGGRTDVLWLLVNRKARFKDGNIDLVDGRETNAVFFNLVDFEPGSCYYDLYHGENITKQVEVTMGSVIKASFRVTIDPMDYGAVCAI